jgi:thiol-disulfide isomerase/thioredoxin
MATGGGIASILVSGAMAVGALFVGMQILGGGSARNLFGKPKGSGGADSSSDADEVREDARAAAARVRAGSGLMAAPRGTMAAKAPAVASGGATPSLDALLAPGGYQGPPTMVLLTASWCPHCQTLKEGDEYRALKAGSQQFPLIGSRLIELDADDDKAAEERIKASGVPIEGYPTALLFRAGAKPVEVRGIQKSIAEALQSIA